MTTYGRLPIAFSRGEGCSLYATDGERYLDLLAGISVCNLGHAHPAVAAAIADQAATLVHTSNLYEIPLQRELAERLMALSGMDRAFFANSGAEANEAAIKLARLWGHKKGIDAPVIVVAENSFHGRTLATLTATGNRKVQAGFEPLLAGFARVGFDDLDAIATVVQRDRNVVAVLLEPIQGEGGVCIPSPDYLPGVREICDRNGLLMMLDEIQTGMCRTGKWFAYQHTSASPDVVTLAKALANGVPIGACLARGDAAEVFQPGNHGSTFGGNPLACRAALATTAELAAMGAPARAASLGELLKHDLALHLGGLDGVVEIRGLGAMIAIELDRPCGDLVTRALLKKLLINVTAGNVIRLLPPLVMSDDDARRAATGVADLVMEFLRG